MIRNWQVSLGERIDPARATPLYLQIIQAVIHDIERGRLTAGAYLPSSRELAQVLGVNRKTVVLAYEDLIAQGWLASSTTRGTMVAVAPPAEAASQRGTDRDPRDLRPGYAFNPAPPRPLAIPDGPGLKIDEGAPDGRLFPADLLARAYRAATHRASRANGLQYRDPRGVPELRTAVADMLKTRRGLPVGPHNICITRGSQNGMFLAALALLRPGDAVIVEALTYEPAVAAFRALGAVILPVGLDDDGMDVEAVGRLCRQHPVKAVFVTPHHQFPTTVALSAERRLHLVDLSRQHGFAIIEDDYDHEFHFQSQPLLPIAAYAPDQVIHVGSLSKLLLPALRIGYVAAPAAIVDALAHFISLSDGMGNGITEGAVAILIENGELRRHARKARQVYAARRESHAAELRRVLGDRVRFRMPDGGLAFWLRFNGDIDRVEQRAAAAGLRFAASRSYMAAADAPRGLRLGFASLTPTEAEAAIAILGRAAD